MKKNICIIIVSIVLLYVLFVTVDCVRLRNAKVDTRPLITVKAVENENKYIGLGYSVTYYVDSIVDNTNGITENIELGYGAEFRLLDKILIWAWGE